MDEAGTQPAENACVSQNGFVVLAKIEKLSTCGSVFRQPWLLIPLFALAGCFLTLCHRFSLDLFAKWACRRSCFLQHAQVASRPAYSPLAKTGLAQLIPPPAPQRRSILGVSARGRRGKYHLCSGTCPRHRGHAGCVPAPAPDWLLAPIQTKCGARYGPCRSRDKGTYPFRYKGGPGVSLGRLKGV